MDSYRPWHTMINQVKRQSKMRAGCMLWLLHLSITVCDVVTMVEISMLRWRDCVAARY